MAPDATDAVAGQLLASQRASLVAPAGCGKTELLARCVLMGEGRPLLLLTHTHAGVRALRDRLRRLGVPSSRFRLCTIAGWALELASAYPARSGLHSFTPSGSEWNRVYEAARQLLQETPYRRVIGCSYRGILVDEYQDCTIEQHALVCDMAVLLPTCVLGDPMQGIFGFGSNRPVVWSTHVAPNFPQIEAHLDPWRWKLTNPPLGEWLGYVRERLRLGQALDLTSGPIRYATLQTDGGVSLCFDAARGQSETIVAIHDFANRCHDLARRLNGAYVSMEELDCDDLRLVAERLDSATGAARAIAVLEFAKRCMAGLGPHIGTIETQLEQTGTLRCDRMRRNRTLCEAIEHVVNANSFELVEAALRALRGSGGVVLFRRELYGEFLRALRKCTASSRTDIQLAAWEVRNQTRQAGRRPDRRVVSRTLLVKGLEYERAVVLDADSLDAKNLYVAMTRASKGLTVVSRNQTIAKAVPLGM